MAVECRFLISGSGFRAVSLDLGAGPQYSERAVEFLGKVKSLGPFRF